MADITLPAPAEGDLPRRRVRGAEATLNAGDVPTFRPVQDPGLSVPKGAFAGGLDSEATTATTKGLNTVGDDIYRAAMRQQKLEDANATTQASLAYDNVSMNEWNRRQVEDDPTRPGFMNDYNKWLGEQATQHVASLPDTVSDEARQKLTLSLATKQQTLTDAAGRLTLKANQDKAKDLIGAQTSQFSAMATRDPGSLETILDIGAEDLKSYHGTMTPDQERDLAARRRNNIVAAAIGGHVQQGNFGAAAALIDSKKYDADIDVPKMTAYVETQQRVQTAAAEADDRRAEAAKDKAEKQAGEKAADGYIKQLTLDPTKVDPKAIANDASIPASQWRTREALINMASAANAQDADKATKTYGPGFYDLYKRIHAPDGDPSRLTDPSELYPLATPTSDASGNVVAPPLTVAGVDKLKSEIQGRRTPEGEAFSEMQKVFLANARNQLLHPMAGIGNFKDGKGEEIYLKFLADALPAIEKGRGPGGKSAAQLFNPDSPDYVGKSIAGMKRSLAQITADFKAENGAPAAAVDLSSPEKLADALRKSLITREDAEREAIARKYIVPRAPAAAPISSGPVLAPPIR